MRQRLEHVGSAFASGYNLAVERGGTKGLSAALDLLEPEIRGFAYEGAAMGLALLDSFTPWRSARISDFLRESGDHHAYMIHVGVGWVWARVPGILRRNSSELDPLLSWLAFDGWGFHEGFFHWQEYAKGKPAPGCLSGYQRRVFDQGLGRSFWFANGGDVQMLAETLRGLESRRHADLWSGVGLAATYAGIVSRQTLQLLRESAGTHWRSLAQGSAFAAKARHRAGISTEYTNLATNVLCGMSSESAARLCDATLEILPANGPEPAYEIWRRRIQASFDSHKPTQSTPDLNELLRTG